jgi:hypothetical protein
MERAIMILVGKCKGMPTEGEENTNSEGLSSSRTVNNQFGMGIIRQIDL